MLARPQTGEATASHATNGHRRYCQARKRCVPRHERAADRRVATRPTGATHDGGDRSTARAGC